MIIIYFYSYSYFEDIKIIQIHYFVSVPNKWKIFSDLDFDVGKLQGLSEDNLCQVTQLGNVRILGRSF